MNPCVSIIIINWNTRDLLQGCIESIQAHAGLPDVDIWVVDNASTDDSLAMLRERFPAVQVIANRENAGFARANNQGMQAAQGRYFLLLNSDALLTPGALPALVALAEREARAGMVGAHLLNPDGTFQASHSQFPNLIQEFLILTGLGRMLFGRWYPSHGPQRELGPQRVDYVEGACMLVRRAAFEQAGGLDEGYFMYSEEVDWCYSLRQAGWQVWYHPEAEIIHIGGASSKHRRAGREGDLYRSRVRFMRKHHGRLAAWTLLAMILSLTLLKGGLHRLLRWVSRGRKGREVISVRRLAGQLSAAAR